MPTPTTLCVFVCDPSVCRPPHVYLTCLPCRSLSPEERDHSCLFCLIYTLFIVCAFWCKWINTTLFMCPFSVGFLVQWYRTTVTTPGRHCTSAVCWTAGTSIFYAKLTWILFNGQQEATHLSTKRCQTLQNRWENADLTCDLFSA